MKQVGRFVCLEGIDGAGKTTAVAALGSALRGAGVAVATVDKHNCDFESAYVQDKMTRLRDVIWGSPDDTPYLVMGDWYWIYLQGAWYSAMSRCVVGPLLDGGTLVLADTWTHKYLAKLALRPVDFDRARAVFDGLVVPDLVIRFELDPKVAAARKHSFGISESGNHEGKIDLTGPGFIEYQSKLADILTRFGIERHWTTLDVNNLTVAETVQQLMEIISDRFPALVPPP